MRSLTSLSLGSSIRLRLRRRSARLRHCLADSSRNRPRSDGDIISLVDLLGLSVIHGLGRSLGRGILHKLGAKFSGADDWAVRVLGKDIGPKGKEDKKRFDGHHFELNRSE